MASGKIHRAWFILSGLCLMMGSFAYASTLLSLNIKPVTDALHFSRGAFTISITIFTIVFAAAMPIWANRVLPKIGIKGVVVVGGAIVGISVGAMAYCTSLIGFYTTAFFNGLALPAITFLPCSFLITNWFKEKRGLALGIAMSFSGVGGAVFSPITAMVIQNYGWQAGYLFLGGLVLISTIPVGLFILHLRPSDMDLKPYGAKEGPIAIAAVGQQSAVPLSGVAPSTVYKSVSFYGVMLGLFISNLCLMGFLLHIPSSFVGKGMSPVQAGQMMAVLMIALVCAKIAIGWLNDKFGTLPIVVVVLVCGAISLYMLTMNAGYWVSVAALPLLAAGLCCNTLFPPLLTTLMYGRKDFTTLVSMFTSVSMLGLGVGTPLYGFAYDKTGYYDVMLYGTTIAVIISLFLIMLNAKASKTLRRNQGVTNVGYAKM